MFILIEYNFYSTPPENISLVKSSGDNNENNLDDILAKKYVKGDINQNGQIDGDDIKLFLSYVTGEQKPEDAERLKAADFNGDGKVSGLDFGEFQSIINAHKIDKGTYLKEGSFLGTGGILPDDVSGVNNLDDITGGISFDSTDGPPHPNQDISKGPQQGGPPGGQQGGPPGAKPQGPTGGAKPLKPLVENHSNYDSVTQGLIDALLQSLENSNYADINWAQVMETIQQIINGLGGGGGGHDPVDPVDPVDPDDPDDPVDLGPYLKGDVDNDGDIDNEDLKLAKQIGIDPEFDVTDPAYDAADINDDGSVDPADIALFKKRLKGPKNFDFTYDKKFDEEDLNVLEDYIDGKLLLTDAEFKAADSNGDENVDAEDLNILKNRSEERPVGDINNDGVMDQKDLDILELAIKKKYDLTKEEKTAADLDGKGGFTKADIEYFEKILKPLKKGDLNGDDKVDEADLSLAKNSGKDNLLTKEQQDAADLNDDDIFDQKDIELFESKFKSKAVGDLDDNGIVDTADLALLIKAKNDTTSLTSSEIQTMDINQDGEVNDKDVSAMVQKFNPKVKGNVDETPWKDKNDNLIQVIDSSDINMLSDFLSGNVGLSLEQIQACDIDGTFVNYIQKTRDNLSDSEKTKQDNHYLYLFSKYVEELPSPNVT